jgi:hypothetical protein
MTQLTRFTSDMFVLPKNQLHEFLNEKKIFDKDFKTYDEGEVKF